MAGAGAVGEKQVLKAVSMVGQKSSNDRYSRPKALVTGLKCDILVAGDVRCFENIDNKKCPFASCRIEANPRCKEVHRKIALL